MSEMRNSFDRYGPLALCMLKQLFVSSICNTGSQIFCEHMDVHRVLLNVNCSITLFLCEISESHPGRL